MGSIRNTIVCVLAAPFWAALASTPSASSSPGDRVSASIWRVLAGVREYPEDVVEALTGLARMPEWLERAAERVRKNESLSLDDAEMPQFVRVALERLSAMPDAILIAGDHRGELATLLHVRETAPRDGLVRMQQLRADYDAAREAAAMAWQRALERDEAAAQQYRELLTRFCKAEQTRNSGFACVEVSDSSYYLACPPDGAVLAFAAEQPPGDAVGRVLESWWREHGDESVDHRVLSRQPIRISPRSEYGLAQVAPEERRSMWHNDDGVLGDSLGLVPVLLQPAADQPEEARLAHANLEHARLWSRPDSGAPPTQVLPPAPPRPIAEVTPPPPPRPAPAQSEPLIVVPANPSPHRPIYLAPRPRTYRPARAYQGVSEVRPTAPPPPARSVVPPPPPYPPYVVEKRVVPPPAHRVRVYREWPQHEVQIEYHEFDDDDDDDDDDYHYDDRNCDDHHDDDDDD